MKNRGTLISTVVLMCVVGASPGLAQQPAPTTNPVPSAPVAAPAPQSAPLAPRSPALGIDAKATALLKGMSETLAKAGSMSFTVKRAFDEPAANGQPLFYMISSDVTLQRPDKLKIITPGDGPPAEFYYDGKEMKLFLPKSNLVAVEAAPPRLDDMLEAAYTKAGIYFPFVDFIVADPYASISEGLTSAFVMGQSNVVGGTTTDIVAIANANFQAQIWIGAKDKLPRLVWITPAQSKDKPRNMLEFSNWKLGAPASAASFRSAAAAKAARIPFALPGAAAPAKP